LIASYIGAVSFALGGSIGIAALVRRIPMNPKTQGMILRVCPFIGVALANSFNLFFARFQDFTHGISIYDAETNEEITEHKSHIAAQKAFIQTCITRVLIPVPIFLFPPLIINALKKVNF